jgi:hypothetical protein
VEPDGGGTEVIGGSTPPVEKKKKVIFCVPFLDRPMEPFIKSIEASIPLIIEAGWEEGLTQEMGCPYISSARATMLRRALDHGATTIVFLDYDVSWDPQDLLTLIETEGEVIAGTYRFKNEQEAYMGTIETDEDGRPITREDGCVKGDKVPAGFLKITKPAVQTFMRAHPELLYGDPDRYSVDLFNHGAHKGVWWGEDYAFSRRWNDLGEIWIVPNLNLVHHSKDKAFKGNFHRFLLSQPGGSEAPKE